nr:putative capsid [Marmot picobirnavirus]
MLSTSHQIYWEVNQMEETNNSQSTTRTSGTQDKPQATTKNNRRNKPRRNGKPRNGKPGGKPGNGSGKPGNDPKWHGAGTQLQDSASKSFAYQQGQPIELGLNLDGSARTRIIPGIHAIALVSTVGPAYDQRDPVNLAANKEYSDVRRDKSGSTPYDPVDFALYNNAMCDLYSYIVWLQRAYGTMWLFKRDNAYMPKALLEAQNIDYESLQENLTDFRTGLNELISAVKAYKVPAIFPIFAYKAFAYKYYYAEGTSLKDQLYMYMPNSFLKMMPDQDGAWSLRVVNVNVPFNYTTRHALWKYNELLDMGWDMFSSILGDSDVVTMTGDISARYGDNVLTLAYLPEQVEAEIHFEISVLEQMKNAQCVYQPGIKVGPVGFNVSQNAAKSLLTSRIQLEAMTNSFNTGKDFFGNAYSDDLKTVADAIVDRYYSRPKILTTTTYNPGPDLVLDSTRLTLTAIERTRTDNSIDLYYGSLVPEYFSVIELNLDGTTGRYDYSNLVYIPTGSDQRVALNTIGNLSNFRFHPETEYVMVSDSTVQETNPVFDVDNYTLLYTSDIERIHRASLLAEMDINS